MSAITDWSFGILPIFFVWKMQMTPRTKVSVILILSLGFLYVIHPARRKFLEMRTDDHSASSATIVRIVYIRSLTETKDYSWEAINLVKWSMVEPAIAITAANIATLRPLLNTVFCFSTKAVDSKVGEEESVTGESRLPNRHDRSAVSAKYYSPEFADMLGLSPRASVTTQITAGRRSLNKASAWFSLARVMSRGERKENKMGVDDGSPGIHKTTVITIHK